MSDTTKAVLARLDTRKQGAKERFLRRMQAARRAVRRRISGTPEEAYLRGVREGYRDGLIDGVKLGTGAGGSYEASGVGAA